MTRDHRMPAAINNAMNKRVGDTPVRLVLENRRRAALNVWAGDFDLWYGNQDLRAGMVGNMVRAGQYAEITVNANKEIWAVRRSGEEALCGYSQETGSYNQETRHG